MSKKKQKEFLELFEPIRADLSRFCSAMTNNSFDAKDLINETLLNAFENFDKLNEKKAFKSYLFTIASRIYNKNLNRRKRIDYKDELLESSLTDNNKGESDYDVKLLYLALDKLPIEQKEAIILFEISGFRITEIAEMQNCTESAVKSRLKRGREKLTELLVEKKTIKTEEKAFQLKQKVAK